VQTEENCSLPTRTSIPRLPHESVKSGPRSPIAIRDPRGWAAYLTLSVIPEGFSHASAGILRCAAPGETALSGGTGEQHKREERA